LQGQTKKKKKKNQKKKIKKRRRRRRVLGISDLTTYSMAIDSSKEQTLGEK